MGRHGDLFFIGTAGNFMGHKAELFHHKGEQVQRDKELEGKASLRFCSRLWPFDPLW